VGLIGVILAACRLGLFSNVMALAFLPVLLRGTLWFVRRHRPLDVHKLGFSELTQAVIFGALLCVSFLVESAILILPGFPYNDAMAAVSNFSAAVLVKHSMAKLAALLLLGTVGGGLPASQSHPSAGGGSSMALVLKSTAFALGAVIPKKHSCEAADVSPQLEWSGTPAGTVSFALIMDDPDAPAGTWVHWVLWNLPASAHGLPEAVAKQDQLDDGTRHGAL